MSESTKLTLGQILNAHDAWKTFISLPFSPKLAYRLSKFVQSLQQEARIIEERRVAILYSITNTSPGEQVSIEPGTPEYVKFFTDFSALLTEESDLAKLDITFDSIIDELDLRNKKSPTEEIKISPEVCSIIETFFHS